MNHPTGPEIEWNASLGIMRILACVAVVILHTSARTIYLYGSIDEWDWQLANFLNSSVRWCVPLFVMISGALAFRAPILDTRTFLIDRSVRILPPLAFWTIAYLAWRKYFLHENLTAAVVWNDIFAGQPYYHLYFLFLILGLYAFTPVLAPAIRNAPTLVAIRSSFAILVLSGVTIAFGSWSPIALTFFVPYIGYYALGALLPNILMRAPTLLGIVLLGFSFGIATITTAVFTSLFVKHFASVGGSALYFYTYFSPTVIIQSVSIFVLLNSCKGGLLPRRVIRRLSDLVFGVYLIHPMILESLRYIWQRTHPEMLTPALDMLVTSILVIAISTGLVAFIRTIRYCRNIV